MSFMSNETVRLSNDCNEVSSLPVGLLRTLVICSLEARCYLNWRLRWDVTLISSFKFYAFSMCLTAC